MNPSRVNATRGRGRFDASSRTPRLALRALGKPFTSCAGTWAAAKVTLRT
jgi:hypothetical protein